MQAKRYRQQSLEEHTASPLSVMIIAGPCESAIWWRRVSYNVNHCLCLCSRRCEARLTSLDRHLRVITE